MNPLALETEQLQDSSSETMDNLPDVMRSPLQADSTHGLSSRISDPSKQSPHLQVILPSALNTLPTLLPHVKQITLAHWQRIGLHRVAKVKSLSCV